MMTVREEAKKSQTSAMHKPPAGAIVHTERDGGIATWGTLRASFTLCDLLYCFLDPAADKVHDIAYFCRL